VSKPSTSVEK
jgi:hypothetical protein